MRVSCEIPLSVNDFRKSKFYWLTGKDNHLFIIEDNKRLRLIELHRDVPSNFQSAAMGQGQTCTCLSWNRDCSLLAIVLNERQIYFWDYRSNILTQFKPSESPTNILVSRKSHNRPKEISLVCWSKLSQRLAVCYSTGGILLCTFAKSLSSTTEKFIDSSVGVLKKIIATEASDHIDLFACLTVTGEISVLTFDGVVKWYLQGNTNFLFNMKFSSPIDDYIILPSASTIKRKTIWLAYQAGDDSIYMKNIHPEEDESQDVKPMANIIGRGPDNCRLIDYFWLDDSNQAMFCFADGNVMVAQIESRSNSPEISLKEIYREKLPNTTSGNVDVIADNNNINSASITPKDTTFKMFKLIRRPRESGYASCQTYAFLAATSYKVFHYEFYESKDTRKQLSSFELIDDLDLKPRLQQVNFEIERLSWNLDCSILILQLTSGHLLAYQTGIKNHLLAVHGSRMAFISAHNEVTILNYGNSNKNSVGRSATEESYQLPASTSANSDGNHSLASESSGGDKLANNKNDTSELISDMSDSHNAQIINVGLNPSVLGIGPDHLALTLNNRVRLYPLELCQSGMSSANENGTTGGYQISYHEEEFMMIVVGLELCSRYMAILFDDGRLKLQAISQDIALPSGERSISDCDNERFFPDPSRLEKITSFILTDNLLVYTTDRLNIVVFCLLNWTLAQTCDHSKIVDRPIKKLKTNGIGSKFICLIDPNQAHEIISNVYLYDLYSNQLYFIIQRQQKLYNEFYKHQLIELSKLLPYQLFGIDSKNIINMANQSNIKIGKTSQQVELRYQLNRPRSRNDLTNIIDVIWDTDERTLLLIERRIVHVVVILEHTLEDQQPIIEIVASQSKSINYDVLYLTQGIVSYLSSSGRVINSTLDTHDDESKLIKLANQIQLINDQCSNDCVDIQASSCDEVLLTAQCDIALLKLDYIRTILPIYTLTKCRDICNHLMSDEHLKLKPLDQTVSLTLDENYHSASSLIDQSIWRQLAAWGIYCSHLNFALSVYREHELLLHSHILNEIIDGIQRHGCDSRKSVKAKLVSMLTAMDLTD